MGTETWTDDAVADRPPVEDSDPKASRLGRTTVLPRLEREGEQPKVVIGREDRYQALEELGRGGLGVVLGARDRDIGRRVAIKQMRDDRRSDKTLLRFAEEIRTVGRLDHPNIVPIHDVGADEAGNPYFVMKYVEGETLAQIIGKLREGDAEAHAHWTFPRRMEVFRKVLDAVGFAHDLGVVHRDLKPENIMVGTHGEVHVVDWGIAYRDTSPDLSGLQGDDAPDERVTHTRAGAVIGTPGYMSPEQARGEPVDVTSDIYSLGAVLYEWLTLQHYLGALDGYEDVDAILEAVQKHQPEGPAMLTVPHQPGVPSDLHWMVLQALNKDATKRYPSIEAWLDRLDGLDVGRIPIQCPFSLQKWVLRKAQVALDSHPFAWTAAVLSLAVLLVGAITTGMLFSFVVGAVLI